MKYIKTEIEGVYILEPKVFEDARGYFLRHSKVLISKIMSVT